ncbi:NTP transferase domain-containing protein [Nocardioides sp. ChNu-153]|uniref:molybdenum cofactor guanylyltransferase n=1 Tax=unclassified Nocardioides TaxID=2615069 RepID=UPI002407709F|nr:MULTISPECIES: NTP transferase domain-containing protein [unclassified Nocardioides]MDF9714930.1 NTP transferase domain-containing protein [Nocardioides sp. ChNu-99]MDN7122473.1 NTP transferase domain-containing protein [Nocardioides sp. ChNu-153]
MGDLAGVVLAGGRGNRLGGVEKARLVVGGRTLLDRALDACAAASEVVVVGPVVPTERAVAFVREEPAYGGPAAGLLAGVAALGATVRRVVVLAVDMPHVTAATVTRLGAAHDGAEAADGAVLLGADGRRQLAMVLDVAALQAVAPPPDDRAGLPVHVLVSGLRLVEVPALEREGEDVDTWDDAHAAGVPVLRPPAP